jgi:hypothetical protein
MNRQILQQNCSNASGGASTARRKGMQMWALVPLTALVAAGIAGPSEADAGSLAGSWSGGGWVSFSTGTKEKARCRAQYSRASSNSYTLTATCATSSGKASQTATVFKVTTDRYRGSFHNAEYNVRGTIRVVVHGSSQSVSLAGDGASASLSLRRR